MSIFAVIQQNASGPAGTLENAVRTSGLPWHPIQTDAWLVSYRGSAVALTEALRISPDGAVGTALVLEVSSYYGRANPAIWSWMKSNWEGLPLG